MPAALPPVVGLVVVFLASALVGVAASLTERRGVLIVAKPLTTALLFLVAGQPHSQFGWLIDLGIFFSLAGDTALLFPSKNALLIGLGIFLGAHISYIVAFAGAAGNGLFAAPVLLCGAVMLGASALLLRRLWSGASGMRVPLVIYAAALSGMVTTAFASSMASVPVTAALGAALFYVGDASLAIDQFHRRFKLAPLLTLGVYWLGQLGIALAARAAGG